MGAVWASATTTDQLVPPYWIGCDEAYVVDAMHDADAVMAMPYASEHGRTGKIPCAAIVAQILQREISDIAPS